MVILRQMKNLSSNWKITILLYVTNYKIPTWNTVDTLD